MSRKYSEAERAEALELSKEIGIAAAARRLGINENTLYSWRGREKERAAAAAMPTDEAALRTENERLKRELRDAREDVELLQEALGFFARLRRR